ncbi:TPA: site-specific DNA-methyltransferase [Escherichia coli]|nr:site-specific DNA-methyltransferase [Escherichia coli]
MVDTVKISSCELINTDCLEFIQTLSENSVDLIVTDPPYFKVKPEGWDNQWKGDDDYLKWLDQCLAQFWRVLKPAGSLYLFCGHRLASDIEIMMRERFNVLNHIIWAKPSGRWNGCNKESLRAYFPATERITYSELNRQYASLLEEYKSLRRYFSVSAAVPYTDVWTHKPVQYYPGKHPCEKPADMLRQIISASSRPGDVVADFFMGSGATIKAAMGLGRRTIGVELESGRFEQTVGEILVLNDKLRNAQLDKNRS